MDFKTIVPTYLLNTDISLNVYLTVLQYHTYVEKYAFEGSVS